MADERTAFGDARLVPQDGMLVEDRRRGVAVQRAGECDPLLAEIDLGGRGRHALRVDLHCQPAARIAATGGGATRSPPRHAAHLRRQLGGYAPAVAATVPACSRISADRSTRVRLIDHAAAKKNGTSNTNVTATAWRRMGWVLRIRKQLL